MKTFQKFPTGKQFQAGVALGYIKKKIHLSQNSNDPESYYCAFLLTTRTSDDKHTELHCYLEGEDAYNFANQFQQYDVLQIFFEVNHTWHWESKTVKNRVHVLGWAAYQAFYNANFPTMTDDEEEFVHKMLDIYRNQQPLPTEEEVYVWKAIKKQMEKGS